MKNHDLDGRVLANLPGIMAVILRAKLDLGQLPVVQFSFSSER